MRKVLVSERKYKQLLQDNLDMRDSRCTQFHRCSKCGRIHDAGYICFYCGHDDSR